MRYNFFCLYSVLSNMNDFYTYLFGTLTGTTTSSQSGPESNDNEGLLHIP